MTLHQDAVAARSVPRGSIDLVACGDCGLVFNASFDAATQHDDSSHYEETQGFSPTFRGYSAELGRRLIDRHGLEDGLVLEIGCGKAGFLATMCGLSGMRGVGVDPTVEPGRVPRELQDRLLVIRDRYRDDHEQWAREADLICCRHTLEHLVDPQEILGPLRRHLEGREDVPVFIDVPSGGHVFEVGGCWDVYYEHCMYYRDEAFVRMLERSGFEVRDLRREYEGQYLCVDAVVGEPIERCDTIEPPDLGPLHRHRQAWSDWFASDARGHVVLWGSGSRAVGFLGAVDVDGGVTGVVDINPRRRGRWMPGFEHAILGPEDLCEHPPDAVVIMNPAYEREIRGDLDRLGIPADVEVVDRPPAGKAPRGT